MIVYVFHSHALRRVKIGLAKDVAQRFRQLTRAYGELTLVRSFEGGAKLEEALHHHYERHRIVPPGCLEERRTGDTEWFHAEPVLATIQELDPAPLLAAFKLTRLYEVRLDRADVLQLKRQGMTVGDAVKRAVATNLRKSE